MIKNYSILFLLSLIPTILIVYFFKPTFEESVDNRLRKSRSLVEKGHLDSAIWEIQNIRHYEFHYESARKLIDSIEILQDELYVKELKIELKKTTEELKNGIELDWNKYPLGAFYISIMKASSYGNIINSAINRLNLDSSYASKIKSLGINFQEREFPKMRKMYSMKVDSLLVEENIRVETNGKMNKTLVFSSDKFSSSYNWEYLKCSSLEFVRLRFTSIIFKKSTNDKVVKSYTLESDPDSIFGVSLPCGLEFGFLTNLDHRKKIIALNPPL